MPKKIDLLRLPRHASGTFGVLSHEGIPFAVTLELPWKENRPRESCIPIGTYVCGPFRSPKFGDCFEVKYVPGRSAILLHKGNTTADTAGCILVAEKFDWIKKDGKMWPGVAESAIGFQQLADIVRGEQAWTLRIREVFN